MARTRKASKPKTADRDPVDVLYDFESLEVEYDEAQYSYSYRLPAALYKEVLALLKRAKRDAPGKPPKHYADRDTDSIVMGRAKTRLEMLSEKYRGSRGGRDQALAEASEYDATTDKRPEGKRLSAGAIRERLEHPGNYPAPPQPRFTFWRRG
jgi:hypothetical protein